MRFITACLCLFGFNQVSAQNYYPQFDSIIGPSSCPDVNIISKTQWGARDSRGSTLILVPVREFFIHHTDTDSCYDISTCSARVRQIQKLHMDNGWDDIGYSFLVGGDGRVYRGRGWTRVGAHTPGHNDQSFNAAMIGNFKSHLPTQKALTAVKNLMECGIRLGKISASYQLFGNRDAVNTESPGDTLYNHIQTWPTYHINVQDCSILGSCPSSPTPERTTTTQAPTTTAGSGGCSNVNIISRSEWDASDPKSNSSIQVPVSEFFIHHTASSECDTFSTCSKEVKRIQNWHMNDNKWSDIGYSFLVGGDGNVYQGRGWTGVGAHTYGHNRKSFAASMMGNFMKDLPTSQALTAAKNLIECGVELGKISPTYQLLGHRDATSTECPGDRLYEHIKTWPHYNVPDCSLSGSCPSSPTPQTIPTQAPTTTAECPEAMEIACEIESLHNVNTIRLIAFHPSGKVDKAYPILNIQDACLGKKAHRSNYSCGECSKGPAPGGSVCLSPNILKYIKAVYQKIGWIQINSIAGACHSCKSKHYLGKAADIQKTTSLKDSDVSTMKTECERLTGGWFLNEGSHLHCQVG